MNAAMYRVSWISLYIAGALCPEHSGAGNNHLQSDLDFRLAVKFVFQLDNNSKHTAKNKKKSLFETTLWMFFSGLARDQTWTLLNISVEIWKWLSTIAPHSTLSLRGSAKKNEQKVVIAVKGASTFALSSWRLSML